jgi:hypothetical protein
MKALRFKVTVAPVILGDKPRVYFVYGRTQRKALARLPAELVRDAGVEEVGFVDEHGVVHFPADEVLAIMESTRDDRVAPGSSLNR